MEGGGGTPPPPPQLWTRYNQVKIFCKIYLSNVKCIRFNYCAPSRAKRVPASCAWCSLALSRWEVKAANDGPRGIRILPLSYLSPRWRMVSLATWLRTFIWPPGLELIQVEKLEWDQAYPLFGHYQHRKTPGQNPPSIFDGSRKGRNWNKLYPVSWITNVRRTEYIFCNWISMYCRYPTYLCKRKRKLDDRGLFFLLYTSPYSTIRLKSHNFLLAQNTTKW
jgi:hypothetical protein